VHSYPPDPANIEVKQVQGTVRIKAASTTEPPRQIIAESLQHISGEAAANVRTNRNLAAIANHSLLMCAITCNAQTYTAP
jgi:hypothetical protein